MTSLDDQQALLLYRVGPVLCCGPSLSVLRIIQPVPLTHTPGADPARPGIFRHSGEVIKTEELRVRFGVDEAERRPGRFIVVEIDSGPTAFWVDDIIDVLTMPTTGWGQPPPYLPGGIFSRTLLLNEKIYLYAEFDALLKLQGHGLLKAYIDTLQADQAPPPIPDRSAPNTIPPTVHDATGLTPPTVTNNATSLPVKRTTVTSSAPAQRNNTRVDAVTPAETRPIKKTLPPLATSRPATKPDPSIATNTHKPTQDIDKKTSTSLNTPATHKVTATTRTQTTIAARPSPTTPDAETIKKASTPANVTTNRPKPAPAHRGASSTVRFITLLLLATAGGGLYYYFLGIPPSITPPTRKADNYQRPAPKTPPESDRIPLPEATPDVPKKNQDVASVPIQAIAPASTSPAPATKATYQARINQDAEGITIVIKAPQEASVLNADASESPLPPPTNLDDTPVDNAAEVTTSASKTIPAGKTQTPRRREILHIVVKGDTLWGIAKHYVNNPFLYPELARLSNIKNPDLIYPGNRVRIIREYN